MRRFLLLCPLLIAGCQSRDVSILAKIGKRAGQKIEEGFGISPLAGRVRVRIQFDRYIQDTEVEVGVPSDGVVRLRATVPDAATRQRILELTRATTGVDQVIDEMKLAGE
jgi:osmotically-inducible protein OsmY